MSIAFVGNSLALSAEGLGAVAVALKVSAPEIWAVLSVETSGAGFLADRRPKILFERHIFSRQTKGAFDKTHPDISNPTGGGYGLPGANQHTRLAAAILLNRDAALQSASWGLGQVMGFNFKAAGFPNVEAMVASFADSEDAQLAGMGSFLLGNGMQTSLAAHDWASFARLYNGPGYAVNRYDIKLNSFYQQFISGALPDLHIRAAQIYLQFRDHDCHGISGMMNTNTLSALQAYQQSKGFTLSTEVDDAVLQSLQPDAPAATPIAIHSPLPGAVQMIPVGDPTPEEVAN